MNISDVYVIYCWYLGTITGNDCYDSSLMSLHSFQVLSADFSLGCGKLMTDDYQLSDLENLRHIILNHKT